MLKAAIVQVKLPNIKEVTEVFLNILAICLDGMNLPEHFIIMSKEPGKYILGQNV